ncbi:Coatomer, beta subunit [Wallemia mellicola]|uniref:Coatomer subunit beta n=1 Tax=Wallemia mellicola TaxID=1708541 RepID=A0AB38MRV6_9BASI|nr:Coatomer, beta subunit [Wallemia mellicola]TIC17508.1 Coatomer, beta subunit [Wallemia mellicola]TIC23221.1 Coatomer, beta subunit [Wallemia mellicola]TIC40365.1 Coatomer, beta subunit [Wallemia mellicola]TIC55049.1 Coatomer, beta subunit [Wallemia mellicola]
MHQGVILVILPSSMEVPSYTLINYEITEIPTTQELRQGLEKGSDQIKLDTLKKIILLTLNGQSQPDLLMPIIQSILPNKNKHLKKLLHFYWEICPKYDEQNKLKQEMILVCNAIRNDLQHPNEFIRGSTLRFLQKITDYELLEPLLPTVRTCLEHRHSYVRKNAVFAIWSIYNKFEYLVPDAAELLQAFLVAESDNNCKRNAFVALANISTPIALEYLENFRDNLLSFDELLQLSLIELIRNDKDINANRALYLNFISQLLESSHYSVKYDAAITLTVLTNNSLAVKSAAAAFINIILNVSDNNVKLIVLARLSEMLSTNPNLLDTLVLDILNVLSAPDLQVKKKVIKIILEMINSRNVDQIVDYLKNELLKTTSSQDFERNVEYRQLLIQSIHTISIKYSQVASSVVDTLMRFLGDSNNPSAVDVISFVRQVVEKFPSLRQTIIKRLFETFSDVKSGKVFRGALWIIGEYCEQTDDIKMAFEKVRLVIGSIPILAAEQKAYDEQDYQNTNEENGQEQLITTTKVLADGTYATETKVSSAEDASRLAAVKAASKPPLRGLILNGDFYTASVLASTLTKLVMRLSTNQNLEANELNSIKAEAMLIMTSIIRVGQSKFVSTQIDEDSAERILSCVQALADEAASNSFKDIFLNDTKAAYSKMIHIEEEKVKEKNIKDSKVVKVQPDDLIAFRQFKKKTVDLDTKEFELDLTRATGADELKDDFMSKLQRIVQLTGFSDTIYAEAYVNIHQFDIILDVLIVNQTGNTMQNLNIEFATLGDLKLVERPSTLTLGPHAFHNVKATVKVSSTETGVIFGNIGYDGPGAAESTNIVLNDIHVDIMDYIKPAYCNEAQFRSMWSEFEWENKVHVNTSISDLRLYLKHIMKSTNMSCLTPEASMSGECGFLSANMYARSVFGEDALANISLEKNEEGVNDGVIQGHVRIRSKTQGIALSLGDKVSVLSYSARTMSSSFKVTSTPNAPSAVGPYVQAITHNGVVYASGCIPLDPQSMTIVGEGSIEPQATQVLKNLKNVLEASGSSMQDVMKTTCLLKNMEDFVAFNKVYEGAFAPHKPARSCFEVARLPKDVLVEVEAIAAVKN